MEARGTPDQPDTSGKSSWLSMLKRQLDVHPALFERGIIAVKLPSTPLAKVADITESSFHINERKLKIYDPLTYDPVTKTGTPPPNIGRAKKLLSAMMSGGDFDDDLKKPKHVVIFNEERRDETFLPIQVSENASLYVYPWLSANQEKFTFSGYEQFVAAGCLFGSSLKGLDIYDNQKVLIKHEIIFLPDQKITHIVLDSEIPNSYEQMMFIELEKTAAFIDKFSDPTKEKKLLYHLPYYDYILFGVELFLRGRISLEALDDLFFIIFEKREEHSKRIIDICEPHGIKVSIASPFDNLFGKISLDEASKLRSHRMLAKNILSMLGLAHDEVNPREIDEKKREQNEAALVEKCIELLKTNGHEPDHRQVWNKLIGSLRPHVVEEKIDPATGKKVANEKSKLTLENLFKHANSVIIALASTGTADGKTCSILPLTEKQIQVSYQKFSKEAFELADPANPASAKKPCFPSVMNITYLDPLITYAPNVNGLAFYFSHCPQSLNTLIVEQGLLAQAHANTLFFRNDKAKEKPMTLADATAQPAVPRKPSGQMGTRPSR